MRWESGATTAVVLALTLLFPAAGDARQARKSAKPRPRCHLRGSNIVNSKLMKVVEVTTEDGDTELYGCVYKVGRKRLLGAIGDPGLGSARIGVDSVAGTWLTVQSELSNQYGQDTSVSVVDVRTGRGYGIFNFHYDIGSPGGGPAISRYILTDRGRVAAMYVGWVVDPGTAAPRAVGSSVSLFLADGTELTVDSGDPDALPASSLSFNGRTMRWTKGGELRQVTIN
jgi:hypothetical protein